MRPSDLHRMYLAVTASADADFDFGAHVLTMHRNRRTRPVDLMTGERATRKLDKERA